MRSSPGRTAPSAQAAPARQVRAILASVALVFVWSCSKSAAPDNRSGGLPLSTQSPGTPPAAQAPKGPGEDDYEAGVQLLTRGQGAEAAARLALAVAAKPDNAVYHNAYAKALALAGDRSRSLTELGEAVRLRPDLATFVSDLAAGLEQSGRLDEALATYQRAV